MPKGRRGLTFRVIIHLDLVEAPPDEHGRAASRKLTWHYGVIDGVRTARDRRDSPPPLIIGGQHRHDEDDDSGRGRHGRSSDNWGSRFSHSISRASARGRERERPESQHGRRNERRSTTDGRRHHEDSSMSTHVAAASSLVLQPSTLEAEGAVLHDAELPHIIPLEAASSALQGGSTKHGLNVTSPEASLRAGFNPPVLQRESQSASASEERGHRCKESRRPRSPPRPPPRDSTPELRPHSNPRDDSPAPDSPAPPTPTDEQPAPGVLLQERHVTALSTAYNLPAKTAASRFRPGCVYRRRTKPMADHGEAAPLTPPRTVILLDAAASAAATEIQQAGAGSATTNFVDSLMQTPQQPVLQLVQRRHTPPLPRKEDGSPMRKSTRITALSWPKGGAQSKARQVLMKCLGILQDSR